MAKNPKLRLQELKRVIPINDKDFYRKLSQEWNYMDEKTVENLWMAFVRMATDDLKKYGVCPIPHLGYIYLSRREPHTHLVGNVRIPKEMCKEMYVIAFWGSPAWREYFEKYTKIHEGPFDPVSKFLTNKKTGQ